MIPKGYKFPPKWDEALFSEVVFDKTGGNSKIKQGDYLESGLIPIVDQGQKSVAGYTNTVEQKYRGHLPCIIFGDHTKVIKYVDYDFALGADGTKVLVPDDKINSRFLYHYLSQLQLPNNMGYSRHFKFLKEFSVPIPPFSVQKRIAAILDKADALRQKRKHSLKLLDDFIRSVFLDMFGDPVLNKKGWELRKFDDVGTLARGKSKHRPRNAPELLGGPYPLIQTGEIANSGGYIRKYSQTYSELGLAQSRLWPKDTLCITIAANIARTAILTFDACFPDSVVGFTPNGKINTEYVQAWLSFLQKILEENAPESAQKNINLEILRNLDIPLPPQDLQNKFTEIVMKIEILKEKANKSMNELDNQFNALVQRAFRGEL